MESIGERLRAERKRIALSLRAFGERGGVTEKTQVLYEKGERAPDAHYLVGIGAAGVDLLFVLTGVRASAALDADEAALLAGYRGLDEQGRAGVRALIGGLRAPQPVAAMTFKGDVGQQIQGDATFHGNVELNLGGGRAKKRK
jgi:transcriptional regulator with XRE-family HTH domain